MPPLPSPLPVGLEEALFPPLLNPHTRWPRLHGKPEAHLLCEHRGPPWSSPQNYHQTEGGAGFNRDTTWKLVLTSGNPRVLVSVPRGFTPATPPSLEALACSRDPGELRRGRGREAPAEAASTDYSVVSGGSLFTDVRMWAEHGQGPGAGRQGGNQWQIPQARPEGRLGNGEETQRSAARSRLPRVGADRPPIRR